VFSTDECSETPADAVDLSVADINFFFKTNLDNGSDSSSSSNDDDAMASGFDEQEEDEEKKEDDEDDDEEEDSPSYCGAEIDF
jgi:hypothetical protein